MKMKTIAAAIILATVAAAAGAEGASLLDRAMDAFSPAEIGSLMQEARKAGTAGELAVGILLHNQASVGEKGAADRAVAALKAYCAKFPADALALAYHGSAITLQASELNAEGDAIAASERLSAGFSLLDKALAMERASGAPRIALFYLRAENSVAVSESSPFDRTEAALEDLAAIKQSWEVLPPESRSRWHLLDGRIRMRADDMESALAAFERSVKAAPKSAAAAQARALLAQWEE